MERARLAAARYGEGWSQEELAERVGVTRSTISQWERGLSHPYPIHVWRLCKLFAKTAEELELGRQSDPQLEPEQPGGASFSISSRRDFITQDVPNALAYTSFSQLVRKIAFHESLEAYQSLLSTYWEASYTSNRPLILGEIEVIIQDLGHMMIYGNQHQQTHIQELLCQYHQFALEISRDQGNCDVALHHGDLSILLAAKLENQEMLAACLYRRGLAYFDLGKMQEAADDLQNALPFSQNAPLQLQGMVDMEASRFHAHLAPDKKAKTQIGRLLDQTHAIVESDSLEKDTSFVRLDKGRYHIGHAATLLALNDSASARRELDIAAKLTKQEHKRRHAYISILRARTHFVEGNFDYATDFALSAAHSCAAIQSKSNLADLARLYASLSQTTFRNTQKAVQLGIILRSQK